MSSTRRRPSDDTRERILAAALDAFNAEGAHAVSTRHIAAALGISAGNLYYHFDNKEDIVLGLYARLEQELLDILRPFDGGGASFDEVLRYLDRLFAHLWKYRFFYRDLTGLLADVPGLKERYRRLAESVLANGRHIFAAMVQAGWMEATGPQIELMTTNGWIVLSHWFTHRQVVEGRRSIRSSDIREGMRHFVALFSPLLRSAQRRQVERLLAGYESRGAEA